MKRHGNLYDNVCSFENIHHAYLNARKNKRFRNEIMMFTQNLEHNLITIQDELRNKSYSTDRYRQFYVYEPKKRLIMSLPFKDRVVQWAVYQIINPLIEKRYIKHSYACRIGCGRERAVRDVQSWLRFLLRRHKTVYVLKTDITKYFYSIDHDVAMTIISSIIKDKDVIQLINGIIRCEHTRFGLPAGTDGFSGTMIPCKGVPIGNLTSQMIANMYLNELDHFVKHELHCHYYARYMDDSLILQSDKKHLREIMYMTGDYLRKELMLNLNEKTCIRTHTQGIDWLGYRVWATHVKLRKTTSMRMKRRLKYLQRHFNAGNIQLKDIVPSVQSYRGMLQHCDSYRMRKKLFMSDFVLGRT